MNLQRRSEGGEEVTPQQDPAPQHPPASEQEGKSGKQKPVFLYIMVLFTVAFGLMLMSFFMHQRSNEQVLGELHNNVNALEQLQDALDENLRLEGELKDAQEEIGDLQSQLDVDAAQDSETVQAMLLLYQLQQQYAARDLDACVKTIEQLAKGPADHLPQEDLTTSVVSPAQRYEQLKTAVEDLLAAMSD